MFRKLVVLLSLVFTLSGCGFLYPGNDHPDEEPVPAPEVGPRDEQGRVLYSPPSQEIITDDGTIVTEDIEDPIRCRVEDVLREVEPKEINNQALTFVYDTVNTTQNLDGGRFLYADHIHIVDVFLYVGAGDSLHFVEWLKLRVGSDQVAWGGPFGSDYNADLNVDGSVDLRPFLSDEGELELKGEIRAKSPSNTTYIGADITLRIFSDCE